jgi:hypothetical protein
MHQFEKALLIVDFNFFFEEGAKRVMKELALVDTQRNRVSPFLFKISYPWSEWHLLLQK